MPCQIYLKLINLSQYQPQLKVYVVDFCHVSEYMKDFKNNPQLNATDEGSKKSHHAQELDSAQVLHRVLLAHIGYSIEDSTEQDQPISQHDIAGCTEKEWESYTG